MKKLKLITDGSENNEKDTKNNLDFGMLITSYGCISKLILCT